MNKSNDIKLNKKNVGGECLKDKTLKNENLSKNEEKVVNNDLLENPFHLSNYKKILSEFNDKYIEINSSLKMNHHYPILIGDKINIDYYSDIYKYLYVDKNNLNLPKYPEWVSKIKSNSKKDNKKKN